MSNVGTTLDPIIVIPLIGGFIGIIVGLLTIWGQLRTARREQKEEIEKSIMSSENRLKEFFALHLKMVDNKVDTVKEDLKKNDLDIKEKLNHAHKRIDTQTQFFRDWIQRIEDEVYKRRVTKTRE